MRIYRWELLAICHQPDETCDHKHCYSADIMFLICHVTSREHMLQGLCEFIGWKHLTVSHHLAMFGSNSSITTGDIKYLICHLTSQNHVIEGSSNFMSGSP